MGTPVSCFIRVKSASHAEGLAFGLGKFDILSINMVDVAGTGYLCAFGGWVSPVYMDVAHTTAERLVGCGFVECKSDEAFMSIAVFSDKSADGQWFVKDQVSGDSLDWVKCKGFSFAGGAKSLLVSSCPGVTCVDASLYHIATVPELLKHLDGEPSAAALGSRSGSGGA